MGLSFAAGGAGRSWYLLHKTNDAHESRALLRV